MGTTTCTQIITRCQNVLVDSNVRWLTAELIDGINDAQREIAVLDPTANVKVGLVPLVAGTKQVLPAGAIALVRLTRNMGVGGATPGEAPRRVVASMLDLHRPGWHTDTATLIVKNYFEDAATPRVFYVWPPMSGATNVEAEYSAVPATVTVGADTITVEDLYVNAIVDYVLYRAFSKDNEVPGIASKSGEHWAAFRGAVAPPQTGGAA